MEGGSEPSMYWMTPIETGLVLKSIFHYLAGASFVQNIWIVRVNSFNNLDHSFICVKTTIFPGVNDDKRTFDLQLSFDMVNLFPTFFRKSIEIIIRWNDKDFY